MVLLAMKAVCRLTSNSFGIICWMLLSVQLRYRLERIVLQAALVRKDEEMDQELRSLRQQHEQLTMQFKARKPLQ